MQETGRQGKYHVTILPERTYANFYLARDEFCHFTNDGYLSILRIIGIHRGFGSADIAAAVRSILMVEMDKNDRKNVGYAR